MAGLLTEPLPGFFSILPQLGVESNILALLSGTTSSGLGAIIFPNGESMLESFKGISSANLPSLINKLVPDLKSHIPEMTVPFGLPPIKGVIGREK